MKSDNPLPLYFSPLKPVRQDDLSKSAEQSPYLKAVLSDKRSGARVLPIGNSSMEAALRYISAHK